MDNRIQISRGSLELGVLTQDEAEELLRVGFLLPTDTFRLDDNKSWQPVCAFSRSLEKSGPLSRVKNLAASAGTGITRVASKLSSLASRGGATIGTVGDRLLEDYLPRIREAVSNAMVKSSAAI